MAARFLDLVKFYSGNEVIHAIPGGESDTDSVREWLVGDQGHKVTCVKRELTECVHNTQTGITYLPDGRKVDDNFVTVY